MNFNGLVERVTQSTNKNVAYLRIPKAIWLKTVHYPNQLCVSLSNCPLISTNNLYIHTKKSGKIKYNFFKYRNWEVLKRSVAECLLET